MPLAVAPLPPTIFWSVTQHWVGRCVGGGGDCCVPLEKMVGGRGAMARGTTSRYILYLDKYILKLSFRRISAIGCTRAKYLMTRIRSPQVAFFQLLAKKFHLCGKTDRQTDRQTDRRTDRHTYKHPQSCSKYMPLGIPNGCLAAINNRNEFPSCV